jgi:WD repeat-containing protein 23
MYAISGALYVDQMGYAMSRLEVESSEGEYENAIDEDSSTGQTKKAYKNVDNEIAQITKLKSTPHQLLVHDGSGRKELPVSPVKMLAGRESNRSGRGRFSSADRCHILSRYLPVNGPWLIDQMPSRAYVSQFSADGSLFVAGFQVNILAFNYTYMHAIVLILIKLLFQGNHIKIYNVDNGWKVQKNILTKGLRWTITDTSLSPDQRYLVRYCVLSLK